MKVLLCHNFYQQPGGEDQSFADEARLLEERGHEVVRYTRHNDDVGGMSRWDLVRATLWNNATVRDIDTLIRRHRPDVMHCTNTFPLISPAVYRPACKHGVPIVQALRNYRLLCPAALCLRNNTVCESCLGKTIPWPAVVHGCYRDSRLASGVVAGMLVTHRLLRTWRRRVSLFFTLTEFARGKFVAGGLPASRIVVKPNFVHPDPGPGAGGGRYAVFVGRLSQEKGIDTLLEAWRRPECGMPLHIAGDGPLADTVARAAAENPRIRWHGRCEPGKVMELVGEATCLIMPSIWYETFGRTIIEAYACGTPVIASRLGAMTELVQHGRTGLLFVPGNAADLARQVAAFVADSEHSTAMRQAARREYEKLYTADRNYALLIDIYRKAIALAEPRHDSSIRPQPVLPPTASEVPA